MLRASIDIGSNSTLLLVADLSNGLSILESHSRVTGLGKGLEGTGSFLDESMEDTISALSEYKEICLKHNIKSEDVIVTATEASRKALNSTEFYERVKEELGFDAYIINGTGEAYYSTMGVLLEPLVDKSNLVIMDIGGASTEFIKVVDGKIKDSISLPIGVVRGTSWIEAGEFESKVESELVKLGETFNTSRLYCVAGTMTSIANIQLGNRDFIEQEVHNSDFTTEQLFKVFSDIEGLDKESILKSYPFLGKRVHTIKAGCKLAGTLIKFLKVEKISLSTFGLRYGTVYAGEIKSEFIERHF